MMGKFIVKLDENDNIIYVWHTGTDTYYRVNEIEDLLNNLLDRLDMAEAELDCLEEFILFAKERSKIAW